MLAHTKKHHTSLKSREAQLKAIIYFHYKGATYAIPKTVADKYKVEEESSTEMDSQSIGADELYGPLEEAYTKPGGLLRGLRVREGLTQVEFAKKLDITQANLSSMENGKRTIGKELAKRIAAAFNIDYRYLL